MKKLFRALLCAALLCTLLLTTAHADMGPKPSVRITLEGLDGSLCYGTLLSERESTGPSSVWNGVAEHAQHSGNVDWAVLDEATWQAFVDYADSDGYHFLQEGWRVDETGQLAWTYYPPSRFKILLYFPESGTFLSSDICERYAFDSYFTARLTTSGLVVEKSYNYSGELISLGCRIVITIALELALALLMGFRRKKPFITIAAVNAVTQIALNVMLNIINYRSGYLAFMFNYVLLELLVLVIESVVFFLLLGRSGEERHKITHILLYTLLANALSFAAGFAVAKLLPGIF